MTQFNDLFKKKLRGQQFEEKDKYWTQLEKRLNEAERENGFYLRFKKWFLPFLFIGVAGLALYIYSQQAEKPTIAVSESSKTVKQTNKQNYTLTANSSEGNDAPMNIQSVEEVSVVKPSQQAVDVINGEQKNHTERMHEAIKAMNPKTQKPTAENSNLEKNTTQNKAFVSAKFNPQNTQENLPSVVLENRATLAETQNDNQASLNLEPKQITIPSESIVSSKQLLSLPGIVFKTLPIKGISSMPFFEATQATPALVNAFPSNKKLKSELHLTVYGGAMTSMKNLWLKDLNLDNYLSRRKAEEQSAIAPNIGVDIEYMLGHWTLTSGINFHQQCDTRNYSERFKRQVPYDSIVFNINQNSAWMYDTTVFSTYQYSNIINSMDSTITYYDQSSGVFLTTTIPVNNIQSIITDTNFYYQIDSMLIQTIDTTTTAYQLSRLQTVNDANQPHLKGKNTFTYIEVPLLIGYERGFRRFRYSIKGGVGVGFLTRQQSYYLATDESEIIPISSEVYQKVIYSGVVRLGLHYSITPQLGIDLVPFSRMNFNRMTNDKASAQQRYRNLGLQIGLRLKL
jgi:hypothetical protein